MLSKLFRTKIKYSVSFFLEYWGGRQENVQEFQGSK